MTLVVSTHGNTETALGRPPPPSLRRWGVKRRRLGNMWKAMAVLLLCWERLGMRTSGKREEMDKK